MSLENLSLDFQTFIRTAVVVAAFFGLYSLWRGYRAIQAADDLPYFRLRQSQVLRGWQLIFLAVMLMLLATWLALDGEETAYRIFPVTSTPSPTLTPSQTPTITQTPTVTQTPSQTPTLQFTLTPSPTAIPEMPLSVEAQFTGQITPNPNAVFSPLTFSTGLNLDTYNAINPGTVFQNPVPAVYATFSYDQMLDGSQWTALWYREGELVHFETQPWEGGSGGLGFTEWIPDAEEWLPGNYQVQLFVGTEVKVVGDFQIRGEAATSSPTPTASDTPTPTPTRTNTPTPTATHTRQPTNTTNSQPTATHTRQPTATSP